MIINLPLISRMCSQIRRAISLSAAAPGQGHVSSLVFQGWPDEASHVVAALADAGISAQVEEQFVPSPAPGTGGAALFVCRVFVLQGLAQEARTILSKRRNR
jgi:hypothetical protein